jgi:exopolysaccharide biosynthesis polyprenyl glycosylphosphotransferase
MLKKYGQVLISLFICSDILLIFFIWVVLYVLAGHLSSRRIISVEDFSEQCRFFLIFIPVYLFFAWKFDFYAPRRFSNYYSEFVKILRLLSFAIIVSFFLGYISRALQHNRIFILIFWCVSVALIFLYHILVEYILKLFRIKGFNLRKILIIGSGELARRSALKFLEHREFGLMVIGFLSNKKQVIADISGIPVLGKYDELREVILREAPDIVYFALPAKEERLTRFLIQQIDNEPVDIKVALDMDGLFLLKNSVSEIDGIPIVTLRESQLIGFQEIIKRIFDFIFALIVVLLATPVFVIIAILIKISSSGPVFYFQERVSLNGKRFGLIKFRTMAVNAEERTGPVWTADNDPRRTKIGIWLRKTGLDELPQFLNVLKGDMSVVGPRPERPEFIAEFRKLHPHYMFRHAVKTGITGLAQVHGLRGNTSLEKRLKYDLDYLNNWSFWLDIKIILMTVPETFKGKGT